MIKFAEDFNLSCPQYRPYYDHFFLEKCRDYFDNIWSRLNQYLQERYLGRMVCEFEMEPFRKMVQTEFSIYIHLLRRVAGIYSETYNEVFCHFDIDKGNLSFSVTLPEWVSHVHSLMDEFIKFEYKGTGHKMGLQPNFEELVLRARADAQKENPYLFRVPQEEEDLEELFASREESYPSYEGDGW